MSELVLLQRELIVDYNHMHYVDINNDKYHVKVGFQSWVQYRERMGPI